MAIEAGAVLYAAGRYHVFTDGRHATSDDLRTWDEQPDGPAFRPSAAVLSDRGVPTLFGAGGAGVVRALGDPSLRRWHTAPVLTPPPGARDPYVWRASDGWRMLLGGSGDVHQFRSADLGAWTYDGVVATVPGERPQLFPLGGAWVLLTTVPGDGVHVAVGDYDGATVTPRPWDRLTTGPGTVFVDAAGRRCLLTDRPWSLHLAGNRLLARPYPQKGPA